MNRKIKGLYEHLRHLQTLIDARVHSVARRSFRPQPWENPIGTGSHSDPTYTAVEFLENDPVYQELKAMYREAKRELEEALEEEAIDRMWSDRLNHEFRPAREEAERLRELIEEGGDQDGC